MEDYRYVGRLVAFHPQHNRFFLRMWRSQELDCNYAAESPSTLSRRAINGQCTKILDVHHARFFKNLQDEYGTMMTCQVVPRTLSIARSRIGVDDHQLLRKLRLTANSCVEQCALDRSTRKNVDI